MRGETSCPEARTRRFRFSPHRRYIILFIIIIIIIIIHYRWHAPIQPFCINSTRPKDDDDDDGCSDLCVFDFSALNYYYYYYVLCATVLYDDPYIISLWRVRNYLLPIIVVRRRHNDRHVSWLCRSLIEIVKLGMEEMSVYLRRNLMNDKHRI